MIFSPSELSPIIIRNNPQTSTTPTTATFTAKPTTSGIEGLQIPEGPSFLRGKVEQQVDAIAGSANKVISGVVDSSFGILRSLLPQNQTQSHVQAVSSAISVDISTASANVSGAIESSTDAGAGMPLVTKAGQGRLGLLRRETGFSIANLAASIPSISRSNSKLQQGEEGQQLMTVLRHSNTRSLRVAERNRDEESDEVDQSLGESEHDDDDDEDTSGDSETEEEEDGSSDQEDRQGIVIQSDQHSHSHPHPYINPNSSVAKHANTSTGSLGTDTRSIRSFESMLNDSKKRQKKKKLKRLAKDNEKIRKEEEKKTRIRDKERVKDKGGKNIKIVSAFGDKVSSTPRKSLVDRLASVGARAGGAKV